MQGGVREVLDRDASQDRLDVCLHRPNFGAGIAAIRESPHEMFGFNASACHLSESGEGTRTVDRDIANRYSDTIPLPAEAFLAKRTPGVADNLAEIGVGRSGADR